MPAIQHILLSIDFHIHEADWALKRYIIGDGLLPVPFPDRVDYIPVPITLSATLVAACLHPHYPPFSVAFLALDLIRGCFLVEHSPPWLLFFTILWKPRLPLLHPFLVSIFRLILDRLDLLSVSTLSSTVFALERVFFLLFFGQRVDEGTHVLNQVFFEMEVMAILARNSALMRP